MVMEEDMRARAVRVVDKKRSLIMEDRTLPQLYMPHENSQVELGKFVM
jgi:hypothetical protein